jgi:acyl dehydratase
MVMRPNIADIVLNAATHRYNGSVPGRIRPRALLTFPPAMLNITHRGGAMPDLSYESIEMNREHGPWEYPWRDLIERYLGAIENGYSWHREKSPWGPPVAPPTILGNATLRFIDSIAPVPPGTLHARIELELGNALRNDRELVGYGKFIDKYERRGRRWFRFSAQFRDGSGLLVGHSTATLAFPEQVETDEKAPERKDERTRKGDLTLATRTLTQAKMTAYSEDSVNALRGQSIHTDAAVAKAKGYPDSVAQGLMSADYISELMTHQMDQGWLRHGRLSLVFVRPVICGDMLTTCAAKREELDEGAYARHVYDVWCENQNGEMVTVGTASGLVPAG